MAVRVFENGEIRELPAGPELEEGLRSGRYQLSSEAGPIGLRDAEGNSYEVAPGELAGALADPRFRLESDDERLQFDAQRFAAEHPARAATEAFLADAGNELTFGALEGAFTPEGRAYVDAAREASPIASTAGTITGIVAPALLSGGTSLAGSGARVGARALARLTPGGIAAVGGSAVERALLARFGQGAGSRALATVGGAVTDGALSGAASAVTRANITGSPLEAEQVMSDALFGAALGLGGGALVAGGGAALRGATRAVRGASSAGERAASYAERLAARGLGEVPEAAAGPGRRIAAWASGVDADDLAIIGRDARRAFDADGFAGAARDTAESLGALRTQLDEAGAALADASRRRAVLASAAEGVDDLTARATTRTALEGAQGRLRQALEGVGDGRSAAARVLRGLDGELEQAIGAVGETATAGAAIGELDAVVRAVDHAASSAGDDASRAVLDELRTSLASVAGDASIFGGAGGRWTELDALARTVAEARPALSLEARALEQALMRRGSEEVSGVVSALDTAEEVMRRAEQLGLDVAPARAAASQARERVGGALVWGELRGAAERGLAAEGGHGARSAILHAAGSRGAHIAGGAIGALLGGPVGASAGAGLGALWSALSHPVSTYRRLASIGDSIRGFAPRLEAGLGKLRSAIGSARFLSGAQVSSGVRSASRVVVGLRGTREQRREEYTRVTAELRELAADPEALAMRLEPAIGPVGEASPALADSMRMTAVRGVAYLAQNLPAVDVTPTLFGGADLEPSQWEIDKFLRRFEAVEDPLSILDRAAEGSLHVEHREAVEAVYPEVYSEIQAGVAELLGSAEAPPPYQVRLQLGVLMGVPSDRSLQPDMIAALQSHYAQTPTQDATVHERRATGRVDDSFSEGALSRTDAINRRL